MRLLPQTNFRNNLNILAFYYTLICCTLIIIQLFKSRKRDEKKKEVFNVTFKCMTFTYYYQL